MQITHAAWYDSNWQYRQKITIDNAQVNSNLSNFPVYVDLSDLGSSFFSNASADCGDIRVTKSDGTTEVAREVVNCDTANNTGELHFKAGTLSSSSDTEFYIYYGNSSATDYADSDTYGTHNVWSDYKTVHHLDESSGSSTDSTSNNHDGTFEGDLPTQTNGNLGNAHTFDGDNDQVDMGDIDGSNGWSDKITVSAWVNHNASTLWNSVYDKYDGSEHQVKMENQSHNDNNLAFGVTNASSTGVSSKFTNDISSLSGWQYLVGTYDGSSVDAFLNGSLSNSNSHSGDINNNTQNAQIGGRDGVSATSWDGEIDEFRIRLSAVSSDWISSEYTNQNSPTTFYTASSQEEKSSGTSWYDSNWEYREKVTIDNTQVDNDLTDFPVYVDLSDMSNSFFSNVNSNCGDIRVTQSDGTTEVPREVVDCDTSGQTGQLHFKAPSVASSTNSEYYIYYGNSSANDYTNTDTYGRNNVWTNGFSAVYHLEEDPSGTSPQMIDSTGNGNDGTTNGSMTASDLISGHVSQGWDLDGGDDWVGAPDSSSLSLQTPSVSAWVNFDTAGTDRQTIVQKEGDTWYQGNYYLYYSEGGDKNFHGGFYDGSNFQGASYLPSTEIDQKGWFKLTVTYDGSNIIIYENGTSQVTESVSTSPAESSGDMVVGSNDTGSTGGFLDGSLDEIRISDRATPPDWESAAYTNQSSPTTFYTIGSQEQEANTAPTISSATDSPDPVTVGSDITFSVDWGDSENDGVKTYICKTDSVTAGSGCDGGTWTAQDSNFSTTDPQEPSYTTAEEDGGDNDYYAFVCDENGACSSSTSGTFTVESDSGPTTVYSTIKADGTGDYSTISAWESDTDNDLVANNRIHVGVISDTATYDETVTIGGATTSSSTYRRLTVDESVRHDGTAGSGPVIDPSSNGHVFTVEEDYFKAEWLDITDWHGESSEAFRVNGDEFSISHCILHDSTENQQDGVFAGSDGITIHADNCIAYSLGRTSFYIQSAQNATFNVKNVTVYNITVAHTSSRYYAIGFDNTGAFDISGSVFNFQNVTAHGVGDGDFGDGNQNTGGSFGTTENNASSDDTAPGSNSLTNVTQSDQFVSVSSGSEDFHLQSDASLVDAGTSLDSSVADDIDGETRSGAWDIGADEYVEETAESTATSTRIRGGSTIQGGSTIR